MNRLLLTLPLIALAAACTPCKQTAKPEKQMVPDRYTTFLGYEKRSENSALIAIATEVIPVPAPPAPPKPPKTLFDLTPKGQAEMEELIAKKDRKIDSALEALANKTYQTTKQDESIVDLTSLQRQITFDVSENIDSLISKGLSPADRVEELDILVSLEGNAAEEVKFAGWNKLTTKYGQYNIGGISFGRSKAATLDPSVGIGTVTVSLGSLSKVDSFQQTDSLIQQFVSLSGHLSEKSFVLEMNSVPTTTLLGRTSLTVDMKSKGVAPKYIYSFSNLFDDNAVAGKPDKLKVKSVTYWLPQIKEDELKAKLTCKYRIRHVVNGDQTYFEGDDVIKYYYGEFSQDVNELIVKNEVVPKTWIIRRGANADPKNNPSVTIENLATGESPELTFDHFTDAILFMRWLQNPAQSALPPGGIRVNGYSIHVPPTGAFSLEPVPL